MCLQCDTLAIIINGVNGFIPNYALMMATKDHALWQQGQYAIVRENNPELIFPLTPVLDPYFEEDENEDEEVHADRMNAYFAFIKTVDAAEASVKLDLMASYELVHSCKLAGYNPELHGFRIMAWLVHKVAETINGCNERF